jgi:hypothetical protein
MNGRVPTVGVVLLLLGPLACGGGEGDTCEAAGENRAVFGPGTGTCDDLDLDELTDLVGLVALPGTPLCRVSFSRNADGECDTRIEVEAQVNDGFTTAGTARVTRTCADDVTCEHTFMVTFESVAEPGG